MSVYIELDKEEFSLIISAGEAEVELDTKIYPKAKEWILMFNDSDLNDKSLKNLSNMKSLVWRFREVLRERLSGLDSRNPEYEVLEMNLRTINQANYYLFVALSKKSQGLAIPVFDELLIQAECLN
jgi:hypothetical protein